MHAREKNVVHKGINFLFTVQNFFTGQAFVFSTFATIAVTDPVVTDAVDLSTLVRQLRTQPGSRNYGLLERNASRVGPS